MADMHIAGLASGYDIQGIVEKMITAKAATEKAWIKEEDGITSDIAVWSTITTKMTALTDSLDVLRSFEIWNQMSATVSDGTKLSASASSSAVESSYAVGVTSLATSHSIRSKAFTSATDDLSSGGGTGVLTDGNKFKVGGVTFTVGLNEYGQALAGKETLTSLAGKINFAASSMTDNNRVVASIISASPTQQYLVLTRVKTGDTCINSQDVTGSALQALEIRGDAGPGDNYMHELAVHKDALFTVNTIAVSRSSNTGLTDVISGVTLDLLDETTSDVAVSVAPDRAVVKTAILDFVAKYNDIAALLVESGKITTQGSTVDPNGASVASTGELYNDSLVSELARNIRVQAGASKYPTLNNVNASYSYDGKTGIMDSLSDIGVWTTGRENTLSVVDESRLDALLSGGFDKVEQMFRGVYDPVKGYNTGGVASDFYEYANGVSASMTGTIAQHVDTLTKKSDSLATRISDYDIWLKEYEQRLWEEFTVMDTNISKLQTQLAGLKNLTG